jgi:hypothetical protein
MVWLAEHSKMFKNTVLGYAATYFYNNEDNIRRTIQINEKQVEGKVD